MTRSLAFGIGLVALIGGCINADTPSPAPGMVTKPKPKPKVVATQPQNVTQTFNENCANCHGQEGEGGGAGTSTLLTKELFSQDLDHRFFDSISKGIPNTAMPAYGDSFSPEMVWAMVVHVRELQARGLRAQFGSPKPTNGVFASAHEKYRIEDFIPEHKGLVVPWSIDFLPNGDQLVTNRPGQLFVVSKGTLNLVRGTPATIKNPNSQGGYMDVSPHPKYAQNGWIYLAYSDPGEGGKTFTKVVRGKIAKADDGYKWTSQQTIFERTQEFYTGATVHFGCRLVWDKSGKLFFGNGERGEGPKSQDLSKPNGKIWRLNDDGSVPSDNPFAHTPGAMPEIWSYGHRNPQGLAFDLNGQLWDTEHGPRGGDELNLIKPGANYGWPKVAFSINYNDTPLVMPWPNPEDKFTLPVLRWLPSIAACGLDVSRGPAFPGWKGDLFAGGLAGQVVDRVRIKDGKVLEQEEILQGMGRVRDVVCGPEGAIYVVLNQPDKIVRVVPAN